MQGFVDDIGRLTLDNADFRHVLYTGHHLQLVLMALAPGEEIAWDYSTTLAESNWHMICQCRSPDCRRVIGNFSTLSLERQEWFRAHNLVAPYLRRKDDVTKRDRAA